MSWFIKWFRLRIQRTNTDPEVDSSIQYNIPNGKTAISITHNFPNPPLSLLLDDTETDDQVVPEIVSHLICIGPASKHKHIFETLSVYASSLTHLIIIKSKLSEFPSAISNLLNLQVIDVSDNILTTLPESISRLKQLQKLLVMYNNLVHLPVSILELPMIEQLAVDGNNKLSWPPLNIALLGIAEIKSYMHEAISRQQYREDIFKNSKPYGSSLFGGSHSKYVPSLQQLVSSFIIDNKVEFQDCLIVPPMLKRHLTVVNDFSKFHVTILRCSLCYMYFSYEAAYQAHMCRFNKIKN